MVVSLAVISSVRLWCGRHPKIVRVIEPIMFAVILYIVWR